MSFITHDGNAVLPPLMGFCRCNFMRPSSETSYLSMLPFVEGDGEFAHIFFER